MTNLEDEPERLGIPRHDGKLVDMAPGQWMSDPGRHRFAQMIAVWFCCPGCGATYELDASDINQAGELGDEFICQTVTCNTVALLTLSGWGLPVFDVTDTRSS